MVGKNLNGKAIMLGSKNYLKQSDVIWKEKLSDKLNADFVKFIDEYEKNIFLKRQGKIEDKLFAELRLRMGAYGQRYDNGKRNDGMIDRQIPYTRSLTKGENTIWDAPGMQRIKIPYGKVNSAQLRLLADLAEEYSDGIAHITTRQDIQLHFVHIESTPSLYRRLAAVGLTTKEACGNSVRNVTACPCAGLCATEIFDTKPYAEGVFRYLLGHADVQNFGRKFKIAISGCEDKPCALTGLHDVGLIAQTKEVNSKIQRGFKFYVGGGLGTIPFKAKLFDDFLPEEDLLKTVQAICRVFSKLGEKKIRSRARIKFLVNDLGLDEFRKKVEEEKSSLKDDPNWLAVIKKYCYDEHQKITSLKQAGEKLDEVINNAKNNSTHSSNDYFAWLTRNVVEQKQAGYVMVIAACPLGDLTTYQLHKLADLHDLYSKQNATFTIEQNFQFNWVSTDDLENLYHALKAIRLADPIANGIVDIVACPGTDTCKLGTASSRGLAAELSNVLRKQLDSMDEKVRNLVIKISGCFNACSQHHVADIGFFGISRKANGYAVPHFQMVLGGERYTSELEYGLSVMAFPSKAVPMALSALIDLYLAERLTSSDGKIENFRTYIERVSSRHIKDKLMPYTKVPDYDQNSDYYVDWSSARKFSVADKGIGECAGEIVSVTDFGLQKAERILFEAQLKFEKRDYHNAKAFAYDAAKEGARSLIKAYDVDVSSTDRNEVVNKFKQYFYETKLFFDPYAGAKFANYYLDFHQKYDSMSIDKDSILQKLQEVQLFIEACHACSVKSDADIIKK